MNAITKTDADKLAELDTLCHADGMSEGHFLQVGAMVERVGAALDFKRLPPAMYQQLHKLYFQYVGSK